MLRGRVEGRGAANCTLAASESTSVQNYALATHSCTPARWRVARLADLPDLTLLFAHSRKVGTRMCISRPSRSTTTQSTLPQRTTQPSSPRPTPQPPHPPLLTARRLLTCPSHPPQPLRPTHPPIPPSHLAIPNPPTRHHHHHHGTDGHRQAPSRARLASRAGWPRSVGPSTNQRRPQPPSPHQHTPTTLPSGSSNRNSRRLP